MSPRNFVLFIITVCLLWLAGCEQAAPEILPTATAVTPQPSATRTQPPTALPSATIGVVETAVVTLTSTPEPTSVLTPTINGENIETLLPISSQIEGNEYQLRKPAPDILMKILVATLAKHNFFKELPVSAQSDVLETEMVSLFNWIEWDIKHFYPQGFSTPTNLILNPNEWNEWNYASHKTLWATWQAYTLYALNEYQINLTRQTEIETSLAKLSILDAIQKDDTGSAWLLLIEPELEPEAYWSFLLPILKKPDGRYFLLPNDLRNPYGSEYINITRDVDVTGDGQKDLIIDIGGIFPHQLEVYSWNNSGLDLLTIIDTEDGKYTSPPQIEFDDFTEDGVSDIRLTHSKWMDLECKYTEVEIYSWRGETLDYTKTSNVDEKPECGASRAITQNLSSYSSYIDDVILSPETLSVDKRIAFLTHRLDGLTIEASPFPDYIALLRLHLAMAYFSNGNNDLAIHTLTSIQELPDSEFSSSILEIYAETDGDLLSTCRLLYQDEWFRTLDMFENDELLAKLGLMRNFGYPTTALQRRICPFPMVITGLLNQLDLSSDLSPEDLLSANGIEILFQQEFNVDNDSETEWLIVVEPKAPQAIILDKVGDNWQLYHLTELIPPITDLQFQATDEPIDGSLRLLLQVTQNIRHWFCGGDQQTDILTIGLSNDSFTLLDRNIACAYDSLPLYSDQLTNNFYDSPHEFFYLQRINELEEMILSGERPLTEIQSELTILAEKMPNDTEHYEMMQNRLQYLKGLTYELSGDEDQAVATYLDLIQQAPSSPWSWLAWARLESEEE